VAYIFSVFLINSKKVNLMMLPYFIALFGIAVALLFKGILSLLKENNLDSLS